MRQLVVGLACCLFAVPAGLRASDTQAADLARRCPTLTTQDGKFPRIYLRGLINEAVLGKQEFRVRYERAGRCSFETIDISDGTPIVYLRDRYLVVYNAIEGEILCCDSARFEFGFDIEPDRFRWHYDIDRGAEPPRLSLDFGSLFERKFTKEQVTVTEQGVFRVARTLEAGSSFVSVLDPSKGFPLRHVELTAPGVSEPGFVISEISVDGSADQNWPAVPATNALKGKIKRTVWSEQSYEANTAAINFTMSSLFARQAIRSRPWREHYEDRFGKVDWDQAAARDQECSKLVREALRASR
jgi:hypothetical protein